MNHSDIARPMPRSIVSGVRCEADLAEVLRELDNSVRSFRDRFESRVAACESEVDKLSTHWAGTTFAAGNGNNRGMGPDSVAMKTFVAFARHNGARAIEMQDYVAQSPQASSMSVGSNPDGGYLVLPTIERAILTAAADLSPLRSLASVVTVSTDRYEFIVDASTSGANWVGEVDTRAQTQGPVFNKGMIPVNEMEALPAVTQSLLDDAFTDIGAYLIGRIGNAFALKEGTAFCRGSGVMQPRGYLSYPSTTDSDFVLGDDGTWKRNRAWGTLQYFAVGAAEPTDAQLADAIVGLAAQLRSPYRPNARWMMSREMYSRIRTIKDQYGRYLLSATNGGIADGGSELLAGFPIGGGTQGTMFDENMPTTTGANAICAALGDWSGYTIVDRIGLRVLRDPFTARPYVLFYSNKRVGGAVTNFDSLKLLKCSES